MTAREEGKPRRWAVVLGATAAALGLALAVRYGVLEAEAVGAACLADAKPAWCPARTLLSQALRSPALGVVSAAAAALAHWPRTGGPGWATLAVATGLSGLVLYTPVLGAVGLIFGMARLVRR